MLLWGERLKQALDDIVDAANGIERDEDGNVLPGGGAGGGWAASQASTQGGGGGQAQGCTVLVLVAPDADALCAARIVGHLLEQAHVDAKIVPVGGYTEVVSQAKAAGPALRSVIMLNCGALPDVEALLWKDYPDRPAGGDDDGGAPEEEDEGWVRLPESARVYVIDAHRPYRHRNLRSGHRVVVLDVEDAPDGGAAVPRVGDSDVEAEVAAEEERRRDEGLATDSESEDSGSDDGSSDGSSDGSDEDGSSDSGSDDGSGDGSSSGSASNSGGDDSDAGSNADAEGEPGSAKKAKRRRARESKKEKGGDDVEAAAAAKRRRRLRRAGGEDDDGDSDSDGGYDRAEDTGVEGDDERGGDKGDAANAADDDDSDADSAAVARRRKVERRRKAAEARAAAAALRAQLRASRRAVVKRWRSYYAGDHYGLPAAFVAYHLAEKVRGDRNDLLWLAIVGTTEQYLSENISRKTYESCYATLRLKQAKLNDEFAAGGDGSGALENGDGTKVKAGFWGHIRESEEPRFVAHRHWSLDSAMYHSDYVASRLRDAEPDSSLDSLRSSLDRLQALCGVPSKVFQQDFKHMTEEDRKKFWTTLRRVIRQGAGEEDSDDGGAGGGRGGRRRGDSSSVASSLLQRFDLGPGLMYPSFVKQTGLEPEVSAADVVYSLHGLLVGGRAAAAAAERSGRLAALIATGNSGAGGAGAGSSSAAAAVADDGSSASAVAAAKSALTVIAGADWRHAFHEAEDSLSNRKPELFYRGLASYMALRLAVARIGAPFASASRHNIINGTTIRLVQFRSDDGDMTDADRKLFAQPLALALLGQYIIRLNRDALGRWRHKLTKDVETKPLVLVVEYPRAGPDGSSLCYVMGLPVAEEGADVIRGFKEGFAAAAYNAGVSVFMDGFGQSSLVLPAQHRSRFLAALDEKVGNDIEG